jgi:alpha-N-arabinofuranosidase
MLGYRSAPVGATKGQVGMKSVSIVTVVSACLAVTGAFAEELHVSLRGDERGDGSPSRPFKTISAAARVARPGDMVTVHEGIYRERINPVRGGDSDAQRIVYQAAPGEAVTITGAEVVTGWEKVHHDTWKVVLPNAFFGGFNPYGDLIRGDWFNRKGRDHHTGAVYLDGAWLAEAARLDDALAPAGKAPLWFGQVDAATTTIWAQFVGVNPNERQVEVNVRQTVFYPDRPGVNFITVRGFTMCKAATPWAPPTAEQIGLIGTHWSKGWIIEDNVISHSMCSGITLGKHGDQWDNTSANTADGYVKTIERALANGWKKETIGHHVVRDNHVFACEQAGIVGSLGAIFSRVTGNTIHDIHVRQLFTGAEMAGIKLHAAIDVEISGNHVYGNCRGLWLDWMAQGTRVSANLFHDNQREDLFMEVNHGPFLVDNNIFLSPRALLCVSQGGAYVHNLFAGAITLDDFDDRRTPFHKPHSTELAGMHDNPSGDDRYYNNLVVQRGDLSPFDKARLPVWMEGNVFLKGAKASRHEADPLLLPDIDPAVRLVETAEGLVLEMTFAEDMVAARPRRLVTSELLGKASISGAAYEQPDGSPVRVRTDYFGTPRNNAGPAAGPFENPEVGRERLKVWNTRRP